MPFAERFAILSESVTGVDGDGNDVYAATERCARGAFAPAGSTENVQGQALVVTHDTLYLDGSCVPGPQDKMLVRGAVREVEGVPAVFHNPFTGTTPGAVVRLKTVTG